MTILIIADLDLQIVQLHEVIERGYVDIVQILTDKSFGRLDDPYELINWQQQVTIFRPNERILYQDVPDSIFVELYEGRNSLHVAIDNRRKLAFFEKKNNNKLTV